MIMSDTTQLEKEFSIEELRDSIGWWTRKIQLTIPNDLSVLFHLVNLSESKKYGSKTSEKRGPNNEELLRATLEYSDNLVFLPSIEFEGQGRLTKKEKEAGKEEKLITKKIPAGIKRGSILVDEDGNYVPKSDVEFFTVEGKKLEEKPSSLHLKNSPNVVEVGKTITLDEFLDHDIDYRYILFPIDGDGASFLDYLYELEGGSEPRFFTFEFNYRSSHQPKKAILQIITEDEEEYILMNVGRRFESKLIGYEEIPEEEELEIDEDFELDLSI